MLSGVLHNGCKLAIDETSQSTNCIGENRMDEMKRRDFVKLGLAQAAVVTSPVRIIAEPLVPAPVRRTTPSVLQGATDETRTQFSIVYDATVILEFVVADRNGQPTYPDSTDRFPHVDHPLVITKTYFSSLDPKQDYFLHITNAQSGSLIETREFKTLSQKPNVKFAVCSCMDDARHEPKIWRDLIENSPDVVFFIGDSVYADRGAKNKIADPSHLWKRFCESRMTLEIYFSRKLIPIFAVWDDHDFGKNDSGADYQFVEESQASFLRFFAQEGSHCSYLEKGPGISSAVRLGDQQFILLDGRSFRAHTGSEDRFAQWGEAQERWALKKVGAANGVTWLLNGSQFFPGMPWRESVSRDHKKNLIGFVKELRAIQKKVIFVSGDVHYSEISQIEEAALGYKTFEITSSPVHSQTIPGLPHIIPNRRRIAGCGTHNYVLIESQSKGSGVKAVVDCRSKERRLNFKKSFEIQEN